MSSFAFYSACLICYGMGIVSLFAVLLYNGHFRKRMFEASEGIQYLELRRAYSPELRIRALAVMSNAERPGSLNYVHSFEELNQQAIGLALEYVKEHPGCTRKELFTALEPIYPDYLDAHPVLLYLRAEGRIVMSWGKVWLPGRENVHIVDDS